LDEERDRAISPYISEEISNIKTRLKRVRYDKVIWFHDVLKTKLCHSVLKILAMVEIPKTQYELEIKRN